MWFCFSLPVILVSFEFIKVSIIGTFDFCSEIDVLKIELSEIYEKKFWKTSIFKRVEGYQKFVKGFPAF